MYDSTLHAKSIARQYRKSDFKPGVLYISRGDKEACIQRAVNLVDNGFQHASLYKSTIANKPVYQHRLMEQALIIRHISESLRRVTGVRQSDRQEIIKGVARLAAGGIAFNIVKLDIRSFYESVEVDDIILRLKEDAGFSRQSVYLLDSFFAALARQQIPGLPRGLGISATLAEYIMRPFDRFLSSQPGVRFYNRFVDDVIVILSADTDVANFKLLAEASLPTGLCLSRTKSNSYSFGDYTGAAHTEEGAIAFLGYRIGIGCVTRGADNRFGRRVSLDIAPSKVSRIKKRVARSLLDYNSGGSFTDLLDRIKVLTSNYGLVDYDTGQTRYVGIRYNYALINIPSQAMESLDRFLLNAVTNAHPSNRLRPSITVSQRRKLLGLTFTSGYQTNRFFSFEPDDIRRIDRAWAHA